MDEEWEKRGKVEAPLCKQKPSEYIKHGNWFFATEPEEETLPYVIERIGDDKILFASDYPHWDGMFPYVVQDHSRPQGHFGAGQSKSLGRKRETFLRVAVT